MKQLIGSFIIGLALFSAELNAKCLAQKPGEAYRPCNDVIIMGPPKPDYTLTALTPTTESNSEKDFIKEARDSSMDMLAIASEKYGAGLISKEQFLEIALQVGKMAEYAKKNSTQSSADCLNTGLTGSGCSKEAMASLAPKK